MISRTDIQAALTPRCFLCAAYPRRNVRASFQSLSIPNSAPKEKHKFCYHSPCGFMVTRGWVLHTPRDSAASKVATPLHGELAPFRLISPRAKLPPQAVARGSSPHGFSSRFAPGRKNRKVEKFLSVVYAPYRNFSSSRRTRRRCGFQSREVPLDNSPPEKPSI